MNFHNSNKYKKQTKTLKRLFALDLRTYGLLTNSMQDPMILISPWTAIL